MWKVFLCNFDWYISYLFGQCVGECNEGARSQERMEEMVKLSKQLDFPPEVSST